MKITKADRGWDFILEPEEGKELRVFYIKDGAYQAWGLDKVWVMQESPDNIREEEEEKNE